MSRSDYDTLSSHWDIITKAYAKTVSEMSHAFQCELSLLWLSYKTQEADLIRAHGWTVLEFENEVYTRATKVLK